MSLQEALFYSARSLRVSPEHISNLIAGTCQWFYLVLFILPVLARRCFPWVRELVRSLSKQETGLFFFKLGTLVIQLFLIKSEVHVVL